jgi:hypothetical protein
MHCGSVKRYEESMQSGAATEVGVFYLAGSVLTINIWRNTVMAVFTPGT